MMFFETWNVRKAGLYKKNTSGCKVALLVVLVISMLFAGEIKAQGVVYNAQTAAYVKRYKKMAHTYSKRYNIPASVILSVAIVESSSGCADVSKRYHNHFGIVGKNTGRGRKSRYKEYHSTAASYKDFCEVISRKEFYPRLKGSEDHKLWFEEIAKTGYSENPEQWAKRVEDIVLEYHL
ncbi:glucosaminidase domain-containing protein [Taibaiella soli]|nr:glucosaminidase domain-containing protein [Taibaiella soli]